jgi:pteridine reductase
MTETLQGKVVLVTGAAKRVGAEIARQVHAAGARVALHYRSASAEAQALAEEFNRQRPDSAILLQADLLNGPGRTGLVRGTIERFGQLDALVNNASSFFATPLESLSEEQWEDLIGTNLKAPLFLARDAAPFLKAARGAMVNVTDIHAERPLRGYAVYCAAKAGLACLTRALAQELAPEVRVNAVAPGPIQWPEGDILGAAQRAAIVEHTLLKRVGEPADIARTALFLLADAPYITGQVIAVDGGRSAHL